MRSIVQFSELSSKLEAMERTEDKDAVDEKDEKKDEEERRNGEEKARIRIATITAIADEIRRRKLKPRLEIRRNLGNGILNSRD